MNQLTRNLACEWAKDGIRVNGVAPWQYHSLVQHVLEDKAFMEGNIENSSGRPGEVEEVSSMVAYLCLPCCFHVTGQVIAVDGGFTVYGFQQPGY
ncbi:hypothetical protein HAX54_016146 [Datura stramonium]|uniref:Uncharacterized protein n=1 Tax=Datura stramonium TaxID=4076 RepID=A0ABS8RZU2_DATST|nr:hypothetical protein [Datura stramonium]